MKVVFKDEFQHLKYPEYYPIVGTVGTVNSLKTSSRLQNPMLMVHWPTGSTSGNDSWLCARKYLETYMEDK